MHKEYDAPGIFVGAALTLAVSDYISSIPTGADGDMIERSSKYCMLQLSRFSSDAQDVASILKTEGVVAIRPIRSYPRPV